MDPSLNELKIQLQGELKREGMVENMKTQLRYKLLERLQLQQKKTLQPTKTQNEGLPKRVAASMVADFLKASGLDYCLSVFVPESGFGGQLLDRDELAVLLKVNPEDNNGILWALCSEILLNKPREAPRMNAATQTYTGDAILNLEQKLNQVDTAFRSKIEGELLKPHQDMEERMLKMKRDLELRMKAELQAEVGRIREFEAQNIRLEEANKHRQKGQEYREELDRNYQERLQKLRDREHDILEKAGNKTKELEALNYNYRQKIMKETELLRMKEQEVSKSRDLNEEVTKLSKAKLDQKERELSKRVSDMDTQKLDFDKKYQNDVHLNRITIQNEMFDEREELRQKQKVIDQDLVKINQLKDTVDQMRKENKQLLTENENYVEQIKDIKKKKKDFEYDNTQLKDNLRTIGEAQRRDLELTRKYEHDIKLKDEEININKRSLDHKENMLTDHKQLQVENVKKLNKDIQTYQDKIESHEQLIKQLRDQLDARAVAPAMGGATIEQSAITNYNNQDHQQRLNYLKLEMDDNRIKRQEEARRLKEDWYQDKPAFQMRFQETWDVHNSSVEFSQGASMFRRGAPRVGENIQESIQMSTSKVRPNDDPMNIFRMEEDQSQIVQSSLFNKRRNIIEETYNEQYE